MKKIVPRDTTFEQLLEEYYRKFGYIPTSFAYHGTQEDFDHQTPYGKIRIEFSNGIPENECRIRLRDDWKWDGTSWHCSRPDRNWDIVYEDEEEDLI